MIELGDHVIVQQEGQIAVCGTVISRHGDGSSGHLAIDIRTEEKETFRVTLSPESVVTKTGRSTKTPNLMAKIKTLTKHKLPIIPSIKGVPDELQLGRYAKAIAR